MLNMNCMLDAQVQLFHQRRSKQLYEKPVAFDGSCYEVRHVSRYSKRRCQETRKRKHPEKTTKQRRSEAVKGLPKIGIAVAGGCHLIVSAVTLTGGGPDLPMYAPLLKEARRRMKKLRCVVADAGFDSEEVHRVTREEYKMMAIIPPTAGRPSDKPAKGRYRREMQEKFASGEIDSEYGQRWQSETGHSMIKRNQGSACEHARQSAGNVSCSCGQSRTTSCCCYLSEGSRQSRAQLVYFSRTVGC